MPEDFDHVVQELHLLPASVLIAEHRGKQHWFRKPLKLCVFVMLMRWTTRTWADMERELGISQNELCEIYTVTRGLISVHYGPLVVNFDIVYMRDHVSDWADILLTHGCTANVIGSTDGKGWHWSRPGKGMAAQELAEKIRRLNVDGFTVNMIQEAFYNGHFKAHGAKVQHVVLANGMVHAFPYSIREHDSKMYFKSPIEWQMGLIQHDDGQPLVLLADQAYAKQKHILPTVGRVSLAAMSADNRQRALDTNVRNAPFRATSEDTFSKHVALWPHADMPKKHRIFVNGQVHYHDCLSTWNVQTLFTNFHTCLYGSQVTGKFQIDPPSVAEYLHNINTGQLYAAQVQ